MLKLLHYKRMRNRPNSPKGKVLVVGNEVQSVFVQLHQAGRFLLHVVLLAPLHLPANEGKEDGAHHFVSHLQPQVSVKRR